MIARFENGDEARGDLLVGADGLRSTVRGRLFGAIEAVGLPERQENAIKGLIRQLTYDAQADLEAALRGGGH